MGKMQLGRFVLTFCQTNCYYIYHEASSDAKEGEALSPVVVIDPGDRGADLYAAFTKNGLKVEAILLTHGHFDHIWGVNQLRRLSHAPVYACEAERALCEDASLNVSADAGRAETVRADYYIKDGAQLTLAGIPFRLIATPGHTAGSCCYYIEEEHLLFSGDTLFRESVGRTDFPTGSMSALIRSIQERLFVLPADCKVYPGHGEPTTIAYEIENNPFCQ